MLDNCPSCNADLRDREHLDADGNPQYWRTIAVYDRDRDRIGAWSCPDCQYAWQREIQR